MSETTVTTPEVTIKRVASWAESVRSVAVLIIAIVGGVVSCTLLWVKINTTSSEQDEIRTEIKNVRSEILNEIKNVDDENTKRFARSTEWNNNRAAQQKELEERMRSVEVEQAYRKGLSDSKK